MRKNSASIFKMKALLVGSFLVGIILILSSLNPLLASQYQPAHSGQNQAADISQLLSDPNAIPVKVGVYIKNYHDLNLQQRRFTAEGFFWLKWTQALQAILEEGKIAPSDIVELTNQIDGWDSKIEYFGDEATKLETGDYYQQVKFSANFYIPNVDLRRAPFAKQEIPINIEVLDDSLALQNHKVVLVPNDSNDSIIGSYAQIDGFSLESVSMKPVVHSYGSSWGLGKDDLTYSAIEVVSKLTSSVKAGFGISVLPLLIVMGIVLLSPSLEGDLGDVRLAIPSTGLLTLIFLQQSYRSTLPTLDYITFLDWLYACAYLISIATFVLFVWGTNVYQAAPKGQKDVALVRINRIDLVFQLTCLSSLAATAILAWLSS